jgi:two-component system sensor kinase FixL
MSRGETELKVESISQLANETSRLVFLGAKERAVKIALELDPDDRVFVDKIQVQQVLLNLMRNAIEAMDSARRRELTIVSAAAGSDMLKISVKDTGPGIAEDVAAELFRPFVTTKHRGMGVGLSISKTIVEAHGGQIRVEPNPVGGTKIRFTLPLAPETDE